tara:strand:+ start:12392 stop:15406 length:3015 start_codon:yes stop_codon:yes gene_type:complete
MTQPYRLPEGGRIDRSSPVSFTFDGKRFTGYAGDTLAAALLANGVTTVARSFKYGRRRGIVAAGADEPNAIFQVGATPGTQVPNVRGTQQALFDGLVAAPTSGWPSLERDALGFFAGLGSGLMPPGFYYKTFMYPASFWRWYESMIRRVAGLGRSPRAPDPDTYDTVNQHCDVLVVGGGPAGLAAALAAARGGARVILADEQNEFGGSLLGSREHLDARPALEWVHDVVTDLGSHKDVLLLPRATVTGYHDHNFLTVHERLTDHIADCAPAGQVRQRLHRVRARQVILATGAHERPLVYANNDVPGCMLCSAVSTYINRYAVAPGNELVVMTCNDSGYQAAIDWHDAGRKVVAVVDTRAEVEGDLLEAVRERGISVLFGSVITNVMGSRRVKGVEVSTPGADGRVVAGKSTLRCDTVATSGGWSPVVHLSCHTGIRPVWDDTIHGFVPGEGRDGQLTAGAIRGAFHTATALAQGKAAGQAALQAMGCAAAEVALPFAQVVRVAPPEAVYQVPHYLPSSRAPMQFVDFQNDVTASAIEIACREGFESIEHIKRYTALGFGTDQGKLGNINGLAIAASVQRKSISEVGTTVFRPNYTPVTFGAIVGRNRSELFDPVRYTPLHAWHVERGAVFEDVGLWKRPLYFPLAGETLRQAVDRECKGTRQSVGLLDASTLGKIDIQGPDVREFLERVYTNKWSKLPVGRCRYGLMCGEDGMIFDDGVTACLGDRHFLMTTTTGGAARVLEWLELYHQTEWPDLKVFFTSVTDHWATLSIAGPNSRALLSELTDCNLSPEAFRFMDWKSATVAGIPARIFRISFTGELSYEINVEAGYAQQVLDALISHGEKYDLVPYGTETMHVLRAEKGFIIVGQDTDGSVHPGDLGMSWAVATDKPYSFIGKRGMARQDCVREGRKQWVGLLTTDPMEILPEGAQGVFDPAAAVPMPMVGHVASSYWSENLGRSIALGFVEGGHSRMGQSVYYPLADGRTVEAKICSTVFLDPEGARQNV